MQQDEALPDTYTVPIDLRDLETKQIVANPMLNGETIRLDGALRMAPR